MFSECSRDRNLKLNVLLYFQVNTIAWNESGEYLLSGADDCHLNIYRPSNGQVTYSLLVHLITYMYVQLMPMALQKLQYFIMRVIGTTPYF